MLSKFFDQENMDLAIKTVWVYDLNKLTALVLRHSLKNMRLIRDVGHEAHKVLSDEGKGCSSSEIRKYISEVSEKNKLTKNVTLVESVNRSY